MVSWIYFEFVAGDIDRKSPVDVVITLYKGSHSLGVVQIALLELMLHESELIVDHIWHVSCHGHFI